MFSIPLLVMWPAKWNQIHFSMKRIWPPQHLGGVSVLMIYTSRKTSETLQLRVIFMATLRCYKWAFSWIPNKGRSENEEMALCCFYFLKEIKAKRNNMFGLLTETKYFRCFLHHHLQPGGWVTPTRSLSLWVTVLCWFLLVATERKQGRGR